MQNKIVRNDGLYVSTGFVNTGVNRNDGWYNLLTGMGAQGYDKRLNTLVGMSQRFDKVTLTELYRGDGLLTRIIDIPPKDMVREWVTIEGDSDGYIVNKMAKLSTQTKIKEALIWSRLFGGSIIVMLINDGKDLSEPVEMGQIIEVVGLHVYDRYDIDWTTTDLYSDRNHPNFGLPEIYNVTNVSTGERFRVHDSRVLRFDGEMVPKTVQIENNGWGDSFVTRIFDRIRGLGDAYAGVEGIITEFIIGKMTIKNLQALISSQEGTQRVKDRLQILDMSKHMLNTMLLDEKEDFDRVSVSGAQGLSSLVEKLEIVTCGIAGIPVVKLFPEQSKGLGSEAAGNVRLYYDDIASDQIEKLIPPLEKLAKYIQLSKNSEFKGIEIENWCVVPNPLWQPTEKEEAETKKLIAETDEIYYGMGLDGRIIINSRYGGDVYSSETILPEGYSESIEQYAEGLVLEEEDETGTEEGTEGVEE